jgi:serine acetyltransferase
VGAGAILGPHAHLVDVEVGERARVGSVEASAVRIGADATVRSFVTLGPREDVAAGALVAPRG